MTAARGHSVWNTFDQSLSTWTIVVAPRATCSVTEWLAVQPGRTLTAVARFMVYDGAPFVASQVLDQQNNPTSCRAL
jgi:hypothetical protein